MGRTVFWPNSGCYTDSVKEKFLNFYKAIANNKYIVWLTTDKKRLAFLTTGFVLLVVITTLLLQSGRPAMDQQTKKQGMTFEVSIPQNTPTDDTVHIYFQNQQHYKMTKIADYKFSITLSETELNSDEDGQLKYRYSRNGHNFNSADYLEPDTNDYFWTQKGRTTTFKSNYVQKDSVGRWRWFPAVDQPIEQTSSLVPIGSFTPRIGSTTFLSGQIIEDLYVEAFRDFFEDTAAHMKNVGYRLVEIDPPWQWTEENRLPKVKNLVKDNPNYPDDATLKQEILAFKKRGIKVMLGPQLCCNELSTQNRSPQWWDAYFSETANFLVHFAGLAEETGVDYLHYAAPVGYDEPDYSQRWSKVFGQIRTVYSGKVGQMVWNFASDIGQIIPTANDIKWGDELDYFYIAIDTPLSLKDDPTDNELMLAAGTMLDGAKQLYNEFNKPLFIRTTYFNVAKTWKGNSFYSIASIPQTSDSEKDLEDSKYSWSGQDLARVVQAYFRAIAERPWVVSYAQFSYGHWLTPLAADLSVRGKPAEDIWKKWNNLIYAQ